MPNWIKIGGIAHYNQQHEKLVYFSLVAITFIELRTDENFEIMLYDYSVLFEVMRLTSLVEIDIAHL